MLSEPQVLSNMTGVYDYFVANPILFVLLGLAYVGIIFHHFKIHWRIQNHFHDSKVLKSLSDDELMESYQIHLRVEEQMKIEHQNHVYFRKGEFSTKVRDEFIKRHLVLPINNRSES